MMTNIAPQVDQLFEKMGACMLPDDEAFSGSSKLVSLLFGYKLIDLAMVSLCVTLRTKGLLPDSVITSPEKKDTIEQVQLLYDHGVLDYSIYEKVLRIVNSKPDVSLELTALSQSFPLFDDLLEDVSSILKATESVVHEICDAQEESQTEV